VRLTMRWEKLLIKVLWWLWLLVIPIQMHASNLLQEQLLPSQWHPPQIMMAAAPLAVGEAASTSLLQDQIFNLLGILPIQQ